MNFLNIHIPQNIFDILEGSDTFSLLVSNKRILFQIPGFNKIFKKF